MNILGIGYEPWETEVVASTNSKLKKTIKRIKTGLFVADLWQFHWRHANRNLQKIIDTHPQEIYSLEEEFYMWQPENRKNIDYDEKILTWSKNHNIRASTRILLSTDHFFGAFERAPAYRNLAENDKLAILYHCILKITETVEKFQPNFVWCIESNYLVKNVFAALCDAKKIPMYTLAHARIEDYWILRSSLVFPFGSTLDIEKWQKPVIEERKLGGKPNDLTRLPAEFFLEKLATKFSTQGEPLYSGPTEDRNKEYKRASQARIKALLIELNKTLRLIAYNALLRLRFYQRMRRQWVYLEDWNKWLIYTLNSFFKRIAYLFAGLPYAHHKVPRKPFFYFPLHYRPEASSLTLNRGLTDEFMISLVAALLPHGTILAVKEHPMMIDCRKRSFYKALSKLPGVYLVDSSVPTADLVTQSIGVLSGSGTALLEGALVGVPTHALGKPEFSDYLCSSGLDTLENFLVSCANSQQRISADKIKNYVCHVLANGRKLNLGWSTIKCKSILEQTTEVIFQLLIENDTELSSSEKVK